MRRDQVRVRRVPVAALEEMGTPRRIQPRDRRHWRRKVVSHVHRTRI